MKNTPTVPEIVCPTMRNAWADLLAWVKTKPLIYSEIPNTCRRLVQSHAIKLHKETGYWCLHECPCEKHTEVATVQLSLYSASVSEFDMYYYSSTNRRALRIHMPWVSLDTVLYGLTLYPKIFLECSQRIGASCLTTRKKRPHY